MRPPLDGGLLLEDYAGKNTPGATALRELLNGPASEATRTVIAANVGASIGSSVLLASVSDQAQAAQQLARRFSAGGSALAAAVPSLQAAQRFAMYSDMGDDGPQADDPATSWMSGSLAVLSPSTLPLASQRRLQNDQARAREGDSNVSDVEELEARLFVNLVNRIITLGIALGAAAFTRYIMLLVLWRGIYIRRYRKTLARELNLAAAVRQGKQPRELQNRDLITNADLPLSVPVPPIHPSGSRAPSAPPSPPEQEHAESFAQSSWRRARVGTAIVSPQRTINPMPGTGKWATTRHKTLIKLRALETVKTEVDEIRARNLLQKAFDVLEVSSSSEEEDATDTEILMTQTSLRAQDGPKALRTLRPTCQSLQKSDEHTKSLDKEIVEVKRFRAAAALFKLGGRWLENARIATGDERAAKARATRERGDIKQVMWGDRAGKRTQAGFKRLPTSLMFPNTEVTVVVIFSFGLTQQAAAVLGLYFGNGQNTASFGLAALAIATISLLAIFFAWQMYAHCGSIRIALGAQQVAHEPNKFAQRLGTTPVWHCAP